MPKYLKSILYEIEVPLGCLQFSCILTFTSLIWSRQFITILLPDPSTVSTLKSLEKIFVNEKLSWKEPLTPYITNPSEVEYWDNYVDDNPWTGNSIDVEDLVMNAEILLKKYTEDAPEEDIPEMKFNFYSKILPLAISYLKIKGEMNVGVLEAMLMQNL